MKDEEKTKEQLMNELVELTQRVAELETSDTERKRAEEEIRQRTAQLEALREVGLEITAQLDLDPLLHSIVSRAIELVGGASGGLYLYRSERDVLEWSMAAGPNLAPIGTTLHRGEGLSGRVWETGEPLIVNDYQQWDGKAAVYEGYSFSSTVGVPVRWGEELLGVLDVLADPPHTFSPADAELLSLFATQAAIAIRNVRLFKSEREQRVLAKALEEAAAVITSTLDPAQVLDRILEQVSRVVPNDAANIMLIAGDEARVARWRGYERFGAEEFVSTIVFRIPEVFNLQQMLESREPMVIPETAAYPGWVQMPPQEWLQSYAAAPITVRGEVIGFLNVDSATPGFFTQADAEALRAFADHAAAAIENARLYEAEHRRIVELEALHQASLHLTSTLELQRILEAILGHALKLVAANDVHIFLYDGKRLTFGAALWEGDQQQEPYAEPRPQGLTYTVARSGERIVAADANSHPLFRDYQWGGAIAGLPLRIGERVVGVMNASFEKPHVFEESELRVLGLLADQAAIAIENARLYETVQQELAERERVEEELRQRQLQLSVLNLMGRALAGTFELARIYRIAYEHVAQLVDCPNFGISLYDPPTRTLQAEFMLDDGELIDVARFPLLVMGMEPTQGRVRAIIARQPEIITNYPAALEKATDRGVRVGVSEDERDTGAAMYVPMVARGQVIGLLEVQSYRLNAYGAEHAELLGPVANQIGLSIQNAQLYEEAQREISERKRAEKALERRAAQLATVGAIGRQIASILDCDELLHQMVNLLEDIFGYRYAYIFLLDEDSNELVVRAGAGLGRMLEGTRIAVEAISINACVARTGKPLLVNDVSKEPMYMRMEEIADTKSELAVPIKVKGQVIGTLDVQSRELNAFDESDLVTLQTLADQAAIAIETARLFAETEGRANDLALLLDTSTAISSSLDLDQILETVARQITTSLVATFCRITLLDETGENLVIRAVYPIREQEAQEDFSRRYPLAIVPWHRQVIETGQPVVLRQDVPELALSDEERKLALTEEVQSAALIPLIVGGRVLGVISLGEERSWERSPFTPEKVELCQSIAAQAAVAIENARLYEELQQSFLQTIAALAAAVDAKDHHTGGHSQRTTELAAAIGLELGLSDEEIELIRYAGLLHDVGKIGISEQILLKPGPLDAEEWEVVRSHPTIGANIVERAASLYEMVPIILHHHERYDGQGYPAGLRGGDIPFKARILSVADAYEAMTSDRAYRPAMTVEQALAALRQGADEQWDGKVVEVLHKIIREQG